MQHPVMAQHARSLSLPAGGASTTSQPIDSIQRPLPEHTRTGDILTFVQAPALNATQLPNGQTITYQLVESNNQDLSAPISTTTLGVQTGAGGVGAPAAVFAAFPALAGGRYWGLKTTASSTAAASAVSVTLQLATLRGAV